ncbi:head completion/stabilization protein [Escherichia coli]|nr:head completion/stabilization protein [Escherichia coli]
MKFVAPEQAPEQAEIIRNTPFWPDVDLSEFRSVMRTDGTVTQPRLKQVALTPCRLDQAAPRTNGDLNALLDETEAAWAVCADKVDMIIACQERNSEQTTIPAPRPQ